MSNAPHRIKSIDVQLIVAPNQDPWAVVDCAQTHVGQAVDALNAIADRITGDAQLQGRMYAIINSLTLADGLLCDAIARSGDK
jgi:hypothetical protein